MGVLGVSRLRKRFERNALIPYLTAGYPDLETSKGFCLPQPAMVRISLRLEFPSDPLADGPILQEAAGQALQNGPPLPK